MHNINIECKKKNYLQTSSVSMLWAFHALSGVLYWPSFKWQRNVVSGPASVDVRQEDTVSREHVSLAVHVWQQTWAKNRLPGNTVVMGVQQAHVYMDKYNICLFVFRSCSICFLQGVIGYMYGIFFIKLITCIFVI